VFITAKEGPALFTICIDRKTGKELWRRESARAPQPEPKTKLAVSAPSPATDGTNVYVLFDEFGLISYGPDGKERWRKQLAPFNTPYGFGSSPIIEGNRLLLIVDCDSDSYLLALEKDSGRQLWKTARPGVTHRLPFPGHLPSGWQSPAGSGFRRISACCLYTRHWREVMVGRRHGLAGQVAAGHRRWTSVCAFLHALDAELGPMPQEKTLGEILLTRDANKDGKLSQEKLRKRQEAVFLFDLNSDGLLDANEYNVFQRRNTATSGFYAIKPGQKGAATSNIVAL
jgi:hypothetical protein